MRAEHRRGFRGNFAGDSLDCFGQCCWSQVVVEVSFDFIEGKGGVNEPPGDQGGLVLGVAKIGEG
jgi:hypothetical protein